ncbi:MAG: prepilin peptidase [Acidobacteria bacterium]|nr:prepilin peptidase [Acidobacteriota bacterium]
MGVKLVALWSTSPAAYFALLCAFGYFLWLAIRLAVIDIRTHRLPNKLLFPAYGIAGSLLFLAAALSGEWAVVLRLLAGGLVLGAGYLLLHALYPPGLGRGDVKLAGVLGMYLGYLGWPLLLWATMLTFVLGGLWGMVLILSRRGSGASRIAFGPFMLAGALVTMLLAA